MSAPTTPHSTSNAEKKKKKKAKKAGAAATSTALTPATAAAARITTDAATRAAQLAAAEQPTPYEQGHVLIYRDGEGTEIAVTIGGAPYGSPTNPFYRVHPLSAPTTDMFAYHGELREPRPGEIESMQALAAVADDEDEDEDEHDEHDEDIAVDPITAAEQRRV